MVDKEFGHGDIARHAAVHAPARGAPVQAQVDLALAADVALAAGLVLRLRDDAVAHCKIGHAAAHLDDLAGELVAQHDGRPVAELVVVDVQVGRAQARRLDLDEDPVVGGKLGHVDIDHLSQARTLRQLAQALHFCGHGFTPRFPFSLQFSAYPSSRQGRGSSASGPRRSHSRR